MTESSRTFLWTEYARGGCGTLHSQGTDPKVWDKLPVCAIFYPLPFHLFYLPFPFLSPCSFMGASSQTSEQRTDEEK